MAKQIVDKSSVVIPAGTMEDFKRPNHPDFMTTSELKKAEWSGIRHNSISMNCEIWVLGVVQASVSPELVEIDHRAIDKAYAEVFGLHDVAPGIPELKNYKARQGIKDS
jgi:hypothetical protein